MAYFDCGLFYLLNYSYVGLLEEHSLMKLFKTIFDVVAPTVTYCGALGYLLAYIFCRVDMWLTIGLLLAFIYTACCLIIQIDEELNDG